MGGYKVARLAEDIKRELSVLVRDLKDPRIKGKMLSFVRVEVTNDQSFAKVYVSSMEGMEAAKEAVEGLKSASGFVKRELSNTDVYKRQMRGRPRQNRGGLSFAETDLFCTRLFFKFPAPFVLSEILTMMAGAHCLESSQVVCHQVVDSAGRLMTDNLVCCRVLPPLSCAGGKGAGLHSVHEWRTTDSQLSDPDGVQMKIPGYFITVHCFFSA